MPMKSERSAPVSLKFGPKTRINGVMTIGDSHVARIQKEARNLPNVSFLGIGDVQAHDWVRPFQDSIEQSAAEEILIQLGGNDASQHPHR